MEFSIQEGLATGRHWLRRQMQSMGNPENEMEVKVVVVSKADGK